MSRGSVRSLICLAVAAASVTMALISPASQPPQSTVDPASLLPVDTVLYIRADGAADHVDAWKATAAYESYVGSGLSDLVDRVVAFLKSKDGSGMGAEVLAVINGIGDRGTTLGVAVPKEAGPPIPRVTIVLHSAADLVPQLSRWIQQVAPEADLAVETVEQEGRSILLLKPEGEIPIEIGIWAEGGHALITGGIAAVDWQLALLKGEVEPLSKNGTWRDAVNKQMAFEVGSVAWCDVAALRNAYQGFPLPDSQEPHTIGDLLQVAGLDGLDAMTLHSGWKGPASWSEGSVDWRATEGSLFSGASTKPLSLKEFPPLPGRVAQAYVSRMAPEALFQNSLTTFDRFVEQFAPSEDAAAQARSVIETLPELAGFDPVELFDSLGDVMALYADSESTVFLPSVTAVIEVDDQEQLLAVLRKIAARLEELDESPVRLYESTQVGRPFFAMEVTVENNDTPPVPMGAICVDAKWMSISALPQAAKAVMMRLDGKLTAWTPDNEVQAAMKDLPAEFTSISIANVREQVEMVFQILNICAPFIQMAIYQTADFLEENEVLPVHVEDLPPAELVAKPLFPSVSVGINDGKSLKFVSRSSVGGVPLLGAADARSVAVLGVGTALVLPAVQAARSAARRTQSKNNLKQLALSLHNFHDTHNALPAGTADAAALEQDERLGLFYPLLPFMEQSAVYEQLDAKQAWNSPANADWARISIPTLLHPGRSTTMDADGFALTHFVGLGGFGPDALTGKQGQRGMFQPDEQTKFRDITDGLSNTIFLIEAAPQHGPWAQGGTATLRAFTQVPYFDGPDGIGGAEPGVVQAAMADGSVRSLSADTDPDLLRRLSVINDGEPVGEF